MMHGPSFAVLIFVACLVVFITMKVQALESHVERIHQHALTQAAAARAAQPCIGEAPGPSDDMDPDMLKMFMRESILRETQNAVLVEDMAPVAPGATALIEGMAAVAAAVEDSDEGLPE